MSSRASDLRSLVIANLEEGGVRVDDVRVWPLGGGAHGCTVRILADESLSTSRLKQSVLRVCAFGHVSVEIDRATAAGDGEHEVAGAKVLDGPGRPRSE